MGDPGYAPVDPLYRVYFFRVRGLLDILGLFWLCCLMGPRLCEWVPGGFCGSLVYVANGSPAMLLGPRLCEWVPRVLLGSLIHFIHFIHFIHVFIIY